MTTFPQAYAALKEQLATVAGLPGIQYQNEGSQELPEDPVEFVFWEVLTERSYLAAVGAGYQRNLWRTEGRVEAHVFVPRGAGMLTAATYAEAIAAAFRGYRVSDLFCTSVLVEPAGDEEYEENYWSVRAVIRFYFDQVG